MSTSVTLPALGESVTEGTVTRWLKQVGDTIEVDEPLVELVQLQTRLHGMSPFGCTADPAMRPTRSRSPIKGRSLSERG
jgi:2-oxoglutarate dehydrogenase E2 component (dihydrolipoamide succinyltransferase)